MPIDNVLITDLMATTELAKKIAPVLDTGDLIALEGDLGTGKTEFARALIHVLGFEGEVPSPTFTLLQTYDVGGRFLSHFDLYRLKAEKELEELGWEDALASGITLVEWPERAGGRLPKERLTLRFSLSKDGTRSCLVEKTERWAQRLGPLFVPL